MYTQQTLFGNKDDYNVSARYNELASRRYSYEHAARSSASYTLPFMFPFDENGEYRKTLPQPYTSVGANGVMSLSGKLATALYPVNKSFRLKLPTEFLSQTDITMEEAQEIKNDLVSEEDAIHQEMEANQWRAATHSVIANLLITGNVCEHIMKDNSIRIFSLRNYVVVRDMSGGVIELITCEEYDDDSLPHDLRSLVGVQSNAPSYGGSYGGGGWKPHKLYTHIKLREGGKFYDSHQCINDITIPDSEIEYEKDYLPYNVLYFDRVCGEHYGRGLVEHVISDLKSADTLTKSLIDSSVIASRQIFMVSPMPASPNLRQQFAEAENGAILSGSADDIQAIQSENNANMASVEGVLRMLHLSIGRVFLNTAESVRDSERTTAEEVRTLKTELETAHGGFFTRLSGDMSMPRIKVLMKQMRMDGKLKDSVFEPEVLTGVEAISREKELQDAQIAIEILRNLPPEWQMYGKPDIILSRALRSLNLQDAVRTDSEVQEMKEQMMKDQALQTLGDSAASAAGEQAMMPNNGV